MATANVLGSTKAIARGVYQTVWDWTATATGSSNPMSAHRFPDKTVQVFHPTGGTSRIVIEGSNVTAALNGADVGSASDWTVLTTPTDGLLQVAGALINSGDIKVIRENPRWIRGRASTVTGDIKVVIIAR